MGLIADFVKGRIWSIMAWFPVDPVLQNMTSFAGGDNDARTHVPEPLQPRAAAKRPRERDERSDKHDKVRCLHTVQENEKNEKTVKRPLDGGERSLKPDKVRRFRGFLARLD